LQINANHAYNLPFSGNSYTLYSIQNDRKGLLIFQKIDITFAGKELAIALWYSLAAQGG
jgi:hypothetical protein